MQAGKLSSVHCSKSTDSIGDGPMDVHTSDAVFGAQELSALAPAATNHGLPPRGGSLETHITGTKMKAKTAQKRAETESLLTTRPNGYESSTDMCSEDDDSVRTGSVRYFNDECQKFSTFVIPVNWKGRIDIMLLTCHVF